MPLRPSLRDLAARIVKSWLHRHEREIVLTMTHLGRPRHVDVHATSYTNEYVRLSSFELLVEEIRRRNAPGDVAELGVYKGDFAAVMNAAFPERTLYLFDTFAGFDRAEETADRERRRLVYRRDFSDTSVEAVIARMPHPARCVARQGLFPQTAQGMEDRQFCFVSIDTDLYDPVLAGLAFFYPRLVPGGYLFVHDYNNDLFPGAKAAVQEFAARYHVPFVPLTDIYGTAVFAK